MLAGFHTSLIGIIQTPQFLEGYIQFLKSNLQGQCEHHGPYEDFHSGESCHDGRFAPREILIA